MARLLIIVGMVVFLFFLYQGIANMDYIASYLALGGVSGGGCFLLAAAANRGKQKEKAPPEESDRRNKER